MTGVVAAATATGSKQASSSHTAHSPTIMVTTAMTTTHCWKRHHDHHSLLEEAIEVEQAVAPVDRQLGGAEQQPLPRGVDVLQAQAQIQTDTGRCRPM